MLHLRTDLRYPVSWLVFGGLTKAYGIAIEVTNYGNYQSNQFKWCQVINHGYCVKGYTSTSFNGVLDNGFPYLDGLILHDSPHVALQAPRVYQLMNASAYLMFKPSGADVVDGKYIPLKKVTWCCVGAANYENGIWTRVFGKEKAIGMMCDEADDVIRAMRADPELRDESSEEYNKLLTLLGSLARLTGEGDPDGLKSIDVYDRKSMDVFAKLVGQYRECDGKK